MELTEAQLNQVRDWFVAKSPKEEDRKLRPAEFDAFIDTAKQYNLNPFRGELRPMVRAYTPEGGSQIRTVNYLTGIDGYRKMAARTNAHAGTDPIQYQYDESGKLVSASIVVYKIVSGMRCAFHAVAYWNEYCPKGPAGRMWQVMGHLMIGKCVEALGLRRAFPAEVGEIRTDDEMQAPSVTEGIREVPKMDEPSQPTATPEPKPEAEPKAEPKPKTKAKAEPKPEPEPKPKEDAEAKLPAGTELKATLIRNVVDLACPDNPERGLDNTKRLIAAFRKPTPLTVGDAEFLLRVCLAWRKKPDFNWADALKALESGDPVDPMKLGGDDDDSITPTADGSDF